MSSAGANDATVFDMPLPARYVLLSRAALWHWHLYALLLVLLLTSKSHAAVSANLQINVEWYGQATNVLSVYNPHHPTIPDAYLSYTHTTDDAGGAFTHDGQLTNSAYRERVFWGTKVAGDHVISIRNSTVSARLYYLKIFEFGGQVMVNTSISIPANSIYTVQYTAGATTAEGLLHDGFLSASGVSPRQSLTEKSSKVVEECVCSGW